MLLFHIPYDSKYYLKVSQNIHTTVSMRAMSTTTTTRFNVALVYNIAWNILVVKTSSWLMKACLWNAKVVHYSYHLNVLFVGSETHTYTRVDDWPSQYSWVICNNWLLLISVLEGRCCLTKISYVHICSSLFMFDLWSTSLETQGELVIIEISDILQFQECNRCCFKNISMSMVHRNKLFVIVFESLR